LGCQALHATSNSTIYNLLARHGWHKLMPRPFHPKPDLAAQQLLKNCLPDAARRAQRAAAQRGPSDDTAPLGSKFRLQKINIGVRTSYFGE
jgi:hypothetical protein